MTTEDITNDSATTHPGERLKSSREAKNLTQKEISNQLMISIDRIECLENNIYKDDTLTLYDRGHLRNYCRILDLEPQEIFIELEQMGMTVYAKTERTTSAHAPSWLEIYKKQMIIGALFVTFLCLVIVFSNLKDKTSTPLKDPTTPHIPVTQANATELKKT